MEFNSLLNTLNDLNMDMQSVLDHQPASLNGHATNGIFLNSPRDNGMKDLSGLGSSFSPSTMHRMGLIVSRANDEMSTFHSSLFVRGAVGFEGMRALQPNLALVASSETLLST